MSPDDRNLKFIVVVAIIIIIIIKRNTLCHPDDGWVFNVPLLPEETLYASRFESTFSGLNFSESRNLSFKVESVATFITVFRTVWNRTLAQIMLLFCFEARSHTAQVDFYTTPVAEVVVKFLILLPPPPRSWNYRQILPHPTEFGSF